jgi:hypothetical protein
MAQLLLGDEVLDMTEQDTSLDHTHLFVQHTGSLVQCLRPLTSKLVFRPSGLNSKSHKQLSAIVDKRHAKVNKLRRMLTEVRPPPPGLAPSFRVTSSSPPPGTWRFVSDTNSYGNTVLSVSTHGQQSAAKGSSTTVSRSDIRLIQYLDSSAHGLVRRWRLIGHFPIHLFPPSAQASRHLAQGT